MFGSGRPSIVWFSVKLVFAVGFLTWLAASWVTDGFDRNGLERMAARSAGEPLTTGSLGALGDLDGVQLDPCRVPERH